MKICEDQIFDKYLLNGAVYVCLVADGHGGAEAAEFFSHKILEQISELIEVRSPFSILHPGSESWFTPLFFHLPVLFLGPKISRGPGPAHRHLSKDLFLP